MSEELLIKQCAPTLAGIKTGSLFPCPCDDRASLLADIRRLNRQLVPKGLCLLPIRYLGRNSLIYFVWHQTPVITAIYVYFPKLGIPMENFPNRLAMLGEKSLELALILLVLTLLNELLLRSRFRWALGR